MKTAFFEAILKFGAASQFKPLLVSCHQLPSFDKSLYIQSQKGQKGEPGVILGPDGNMLVSSEKGQAGEPGEQVSFDNQLAQLLGTSLSVRQVWGSISEPVKIRQCVATPHHRCGTSSELCCPGAKPQRRTPSLVTYLGVITRVYTRFEFF